MNNVILTKRNCHRAAQVRMVNAPEKGVFDWVYKGVKVKEGFMRTEFDHMAKQEGTEVQIPHTPSALQEWEVVSWRYELSFEELYDHAVRAFSGTSFSPEERAERYIRDYEEMCLDDVEKLPQEEHEEYISKFRSWVASLFVKHSRIMSSMITGPARFPTARNEKACNSYDKAVVDFLAWHESYAKRVAKRIEAAKNPEQREDEEWLGVKKWIESCAVTCTEIDNGARGLNRSLFTASVVGKIERLANNGRTTLVLKALDHIKQLQEGMKKPMFTARHKIWKLQEVCERSIKAQEERENRDSVEMEFDDARIVKNFADNRLQIFHDSKPSADIISRLKSNGFKWSRFNGCWQRQLTDNSYYGAARVFFGNDVLSEEYNNFLRKLKK